MTSNDYWCVLFSAPFTRSNCQGASVVDYIGESCANHISVRLVIMRCVNILCVFVRTS